LVSEIALRYIERGYRGWWDKGRKLGYKNESSALYSIQG